MFKYCVSNWYKTRKLFILLQTVIDDIFIIVLIIFYNWLYFNSYKFNLVYTRIITTWDASGILNFFLFSKIKALVSCQTHNIKNTWLNNKLNLFYISKYFLFSLKYK